MVMVVGAGRWLIPSGSDPFSTQPPRLFQILCRCASRGSQQVSSQPGFWPLLSFSASPVPSAMRLRKSQKNACPHGQDCAAKGLHSQGHPERIPQGQPSVARPSSFVPSLTGELLRSEDDHIPRLWKPRRSHL